MLSLCYVLSPSGFTWLNPGLHHLPSEYLWTDGGIPGEVHPTQVLTMSSVVRPAHDSLHSVGLGLLAHLGIGSFLLPGQGGKRAITGPWH